MGTGMRNRGREGVRQGWGGSAQPTVPTPPYPLLGCSLLGIFFTFKGVLKLDDTDTAQRGITTALGGTALLPSVFCGKQSQRPVLGSLLPPPAIQGLANSNLPRLGKGCWGSR